MNNNPYKVEYGVSKRDIYSFVLNKLEEAGWEVQTGLGGSFNAHHILKSYGEGEMLI